MYVKQTFAIIKDEIVKQDIVCTDFETANQLARSIYGKDAIAIESTLYPISEGDKYIGSHFYFKDGVTLVPRSNTAEENAIQAVQMLKDLEASIAENNVELDYRLSKIELGSEG